MSKIHPKASEHRLVASAVLAMMPPRQTFQTIPASSEMMQTSKEDSICLASTFYPAFCVGSLKKRKAPQGA